MRMTRRFLAVLIALVLAWLGAYFLTPGLALAHAEVEESNPTEGASVPADLREITIRFTEDVSIDQSTAQIIGPTGETLAGTNSAVDRANRRILRITTPPLVKGDYTVKWRVVTEDDNAITNGEIHFTITEQVPTDSALSLLPILLVVGALLLAAVLYLIARRRSGK